MRKKIVSTILVSLFLIGLLGGIAVLGINAHIIGVTRSRILAPEVAAQLKDVDCILVLGCKVQADGTPSHMLEDRLRRGVDLYKMGAAPKILMSGDHGQTEYDEVNTMKRFATDAGIASSDVFMDHAGFSTYESMFRAKAVFGVKKVVIVTQQYHLYRAVYAAQCLGMEAYGVSSDYRTYSGQLGRDVRELLARVKDYGTAKFQPEPTYLGEFIPISGDGDLTND